jgi:hypothetical protein
MLLSLFSTSASEEIQIDTVVVVMKNNFQFSSFYVVQIKKKSAIFSPSQRPFERLKDQNGMQ